MARRRDRDQGGHPVFWLLLGFLCGVTAMLGGVLLLTGEMAGDPTPASPVVSAPVETPALESASPPGGPVVLIAPTSVEPATPIQEPIAPPALPTFRPEPRTPPVSAAPQAAPARPAPPVGRGNADQIAEDAAASGMTARTR